MYIEEYLGGRKKMKTKMEELIRDYGTDGISTMLMTLAPDNEYVEKMALLLIAAIEE